jgi:rubrerythrin
MGKSLKGTKSHENLKHAFAGEAQANRRYLYFAHRLERDRDADIGRLFEDLSEAATEHAFGHLDFLKEVGDPATGQAVSGVKTALQSAFDSETYEYAEMYPGMAKTAREEGFVELADWFDRVGKAARAHAGRLAKALELLKDR